MRDLLGPTLPPEDQRAFSAAVLETNVKRMRILLPIMIVMHVVFIAIFASSQKMDGTPAVSMWRDEVIAIHAWTLVPVVLIGVGLVVFPRRSFARLFGPLAAVVYLVHAAAIVGADQLTLTNMTVFVGYAFGVALVLVMRPAVATIVYAVGFGAAFASMMLMQPDDALRTGMLGSSSMAAIVGAVMTAVLYGARLRQFAQRITIEKQRTELAAMNETLEARVKERVRDIEILNAALQEKVRERSQELSAALARLADRRTDDDELAAGTVLGDRFEVVEKLGAGGMGAVYAGVDRTTGARVALKVINASSARQVSFMQRFLEEARVVATLAHPAIVRMLHVDVSAGGVLFQAQELIVGATLEAHLKQGSFTPAQSARIGALLCDALAAAHARGIVHRDVKPSNVMLLASAPGLKLLDFGIARPLGGGDRQRTGVDVVVGTPAYMAPEQKEAKDPTPAVDVFAVGVTLYRMLFGRLPSRDPPTVPPPSRAKKTSSDEPIESVAPPKALVRLVEQCLVDEPRDRPSASSLAASLARFADEHGAPPVEDIARTTSKGAHESTVSMSPRAHASAHVDVETTTRTR